MMSAHYLRYGVLVGDESMGGWAPWSGDGGDWGSGHGDGVAVRDTCVAHGRPGEGGAVKR